MKKRVKLNKMSINLEPTPLEFDNSTRIIVKQEIAKLIDNKGVTTSFCVLLLDDYVSNCILKEGITICGV